MHCLTYIRQLGLHPFYYQPDQKFSSTLALSISIYPHCPPPPPHQVFGPSIGPVGDCIALRPLDHFVPVRSTANRIKSFRQHLRFLYRYTPIAPPAPLQVFGPSVGLVGDCIALCPLDHFVRVRSTANRI